MGSNSSGLGTETLKERVQHDSAGNARPGDAARDSPDLETWPGGCHHEALCTPTHADGLGRDPDPAAQPICPSTRNYGHERGEELLRGCPCLLPQKPNCLPPRWLGATTCAVIRAPNLAKRLISSNFFPPSNTAEARSSGDAQTQDLLASRVGTPASALPGGVVDLTVGPENPSLLCFKIIIINKRQY